jgi:hypothetical protein
MSTIFSKIGHFFIGVFDAMRKAYAHLTIEQRAALQDGTGLVELINANLEKTPKQIRQLIAEKFPTLSSEKLELALFDIAQSFNLTKADSIEDIIASIQAWLNGLEGQSWAYVSHALASAFSILFAPPETKLKTIVSLIEWVFQKFIKKAV